jgi:hypothetical protein
MLLPDKEELFVLLRLGKMDIDGAWFFTRLHTTT